jgi:hypothetical protein
MIAGSNPASPANFDQIPFLWYFCFMPLESVEFRPNQSLDYHLEIQGVSARFFTTMYGVFGIQRTNNLEHFTYGVCDLARIVDDTIDSPDIPTPRTFERFIDSLHDGAVRDTSGRVLDRAVAFMDSFNVAQHNFARRRYSEAVQIARVKGQASSVDEYIEAIETEAGILHAVLNVSEDERHPDSENRKSYNHWLKSFLLGAYCVNSMVDLQNDSGEKLLQFEPTVANRLKLLRKASPHIKNTLQSTPPRSIPALCLLATGYSVPALKRKLA